MYHFSKMNPLDICDEHLMWSHLNILTSKSCSPDGDTMNDMYLSQIAYIVTGTLVIWPPRHIDGSKIINTAQYHLYGIHVI